MPPEPPDAERDGLVAEGLALVPWAARRCGRLPPGIDVEELESLGSTLVFDAWHTFGTAESKGMCWNQHVRVVLRSGMLKAISAARGSRRKAKHSRVSLTTADGEQLSLADTRADDPAEVAEAREEVTAALERRAVSAKQLELSLPPPAAVATRAQQLQASMYGALNPIDVQEMIRAVMARAQDGDVKAAALLVDLIAKPSIPPPAAPLQPAPLPAPMPASEQEQVEELAVLDAVDAAVQRHGTPGATRFAVRTATGFGHVNVAKVIERLVRAGELVAVTWAEVVGGEATTREGYRRPA